VGRFGVQDRCLVQYKVAMPVQHCVEQHYFTEKFVILYEISEHRMKTADYQSAARYWFNYLRKAAARANGRRLATSD